MAGCSSGKLSYVVVSQGGVAGVGEIFRRLPWSAVQASEDKFKINLSRQDFERLDQLEKDSWPGR
jgi:hypothetical protein